MERDEYAQMYSTAERLRFVALGIVSGALTVCAGKVWFFPWVTRVAMAAPCSTVFGIEGDAVFWHGVFVTLPLLLAVVVGLCYGRSGRRILRDGQYPPAGTKVFRPTRIIRGQAARRVAYLHLAACVPFLALALWGHAQAVHLSDQGAARCVGGAVNKHPLRGST